MSTTTPNLGLFKYNIATDGKETFSITDALNNNWDILDNVISSTSSLGQSGYIKFNNGLTINYGQASISSQEVRFSQPILSANGTMGGDSFAVAASSTYNGTQPWQAFDKNSTTYWLSANQSPSTLTFYNPDPLKATSITIENPSGANYPRTGIVKASNDNTNWDNLATWNASAVTTTIDLSSNTNYYKYYQMYCQTSTYANHMYLYQINITATYITQTLNSITFPCAFTTTNYAYSLAYRNGRFGDSYAKTLTNTGMTLQNNSNADAVYYIAVGY